MFIFVFFAAPNGGAATTTTILHDVPGCENLKTTLQQQDPKNPDLEDKDLRDARMPFG